MKARTTNQSELLQTLLLYIKVMVTKKTTLLKYICYCFHAYSQYSSSFGTKTLTASLGFFRQLIKENLSDFSQIIQTNDQLRKLYFNTVANMIFTFNSVLEEEKAEEDDEYFIRPNEINSRRIDFSDYICKRFLLDSVLKDVPQLQIEFFTVLFSKKIFIHQLNPDFFEFYLNIPTITKESKLLNLKNLLNIANPSLTQGLCRFSSNVVLDPKILTSLTFRDYMGAIDQSYESVIDDQFMRFMRTKDLCDLHHHLLYSFSISKSGAVEEYFKKNPNSYFVSLYVQLENFLQDLKEDVLIEFLAVRGLLSPVKLDLFEVIYTKKPIPDKGNYSFQIRGFIQSHTKKLEELKGNITTLTEVLTKNEIYFNEYQFFDLHRENISKIQKEFLRFKVGQLKNDVSFKQSLVLLNVVEWERFNYCQNYRLFYEALKKKCTASLTLPEYYERAVKTMAEFKSIFLKFKDPSSFYVADYDKYMPRVTWNDLSKLYTQTMTALEISKKDQDAIFINCKIIHSFNKVMKIHGPLEVLSSPNYLNLKKDKFSDNINTIYEGFKGKQKDKISCADLIKVDAKTNILNVKDFDNSPTYLMPMMLKDLSKSLDCYKFVKETADEFIKSMREECDSENLDIVNKLEVINKNLKFLIGEKSFEVIVKKFMLVNKDDQRKIKKYLRDLNGQISSHITNLAEKTKKDQNYNQKMIDKTLKNSLINIKYSTQSKQFVVFVQYEEGTSLYTISTVEFEELLNKAKVISENSNSQDPFVLLMKEFSTFGVEVETMCQSFYSLRQLGVILTTPDLLLDLMNQSSGKGNFYQKSQKGDFQFRYQAKGRDLTALQKSNKELIKLEKTLSKELLQYYSPESYLMTYFYGKKLFHLTQYLRGNATEEESNQVLSLITESIPRNLINFSMKVNIPSDIYQVFKSTYETIKFWSEHIKTKDKIKLNSSSIFTSKRIKTCTAQVNVYKTVCKILNEASESMLSLSQILFCKKDTTKNEIVSFCRRSMLDPFKRLYFIIGIDRLEYLTVMEVKNCLLKVIESRYDNLNFNLLIFNNHGSQMKNMFDNENFENINHSLTQLDQIIKDEDYQNTFANLFKSNIIVMSEMAGMGKTTWIKNHLHKRFEMFDVFLSGEVHKYTLKRRLDYLGKCISGKERYALTLKIDFMEDFEYHCETIDYLLFCICIIKRYYTDYGCQDMRDHLSQIYIEISNTFIKESFTKLTFLELLSDNENNQIVDKNTFQFRIMLPKFDLKNIIYNEEPNSDEQVIARLLRLMDTDQINIVSPLSSSLKVSKSDFHALLRKYFKFDFMKDNASEESRLNSTYAQYVFWLKSLAQLVREMENVQDFKTGATKDDKKVRKELAEEILRFSSYMISVSVDQARTSQDQMKEIMNELKKQNLQKKNLEGYQKKIMNITPWSAKDLLVPLIHNSNTLFSLVDLNDWANREDSKRFRKRACLRDYIKDSKGCLELNKDIKDYSQQCLTLLARFLGQQPADLIKRASLFKGKGFVITLDNFMKISMILLKSFVKIPIVMMGESGCGKTYLSEFVSECLLEDKMKELTLYSGVTELDFIAFMKKAVAEATELGKSNKKMWVFFDEFNTSSLQTIVAEIMIDRVCSIEPEIYHIPENMIFIACCNPYRMKTKKAEVGLVPKTSDTILSHRVYPIPERILNYIWDFGQLSEDDEKRHIASMIAAEKLFTGENERSKSQQYLNLIYKSHLIVRGIEERSGVSLRDIKRVLTLYKWFCSQITYLVESLDNKVFKKNKHEISLRAMICAIIVAYVLRMNGRNKEQDDLLKEITKASSPLSNPIPLSLKEINNTLTKMSDVYLQVLNQSKMGVIPENIAINRPLKENFIAMLACFDAKIPLIICGAPGTSKTLCTQIFDSALIPNIIKSYKEFANFKAINSIYYGGSQTSTSEGISKVFNRGEQYLRQKGEDRPVVVFDEVGLAELSPYNPLKVLHPLLEKPDQEIGFFGLSNWTLDLSKMNRLIYLARPDMTKDDLVEIFKISISGCRNDKAKTDFMIYLSLLADAYLIFRQWQKSNGTHPNFHGSRDIYGVSKFVYNSIMNISNYDSSSLKGLIKKSIERNFNGAAYLFGEGQNEISFNFIENLASHANSKNIENVRIEDIGNPYSHSQHADLVVLNIFSSSQVLKRIFMNLISSKPALAETFNTEFFEETPVLDLISANINDPQSRFLLVKSEGEVVDNIFMEKLSKLVKPELLKDWRGIKGKENSHELLSTLKSYISLGYVVVMKNLDELYGSLYDLFNQKYSEVQGIKYCYLYFGESKHRVEVHPNFKAIILLSAEHELQGLELELEQPAPFLNRFEKFFVRLANILTPQDIKEVYDLVGYLQSTLHGDMFKVLGLSIDMITSIILRANKNNASPKLEIQKLLMRLSTSNFLLTEGLTQDQLDLYQSEHPYSNIWQLVTDMNLKPANRVCMFTFSNPIELEYLRTQINEKTKSHMITSEELINQGLEARAERLKRYEEKFIVIQFNNLEHLSLITQLKTTINENPNILKSLFIIHLERRAKDIISITKNIGLNYWHDWDNVVIEDINESNYAEMKNAYDFTINQIIFDDTNTMGNNILKEASIAATQKIIIEKNDERLKASFQSIREMIQNDPENLFAGLLKSKIKESRLIDCQDKWRVAVVGSRYSSLTYTDVKAEILNVVFDRFGETLKKLVLKLNEDLSNIGSYARHFYNPNPTIRDLYRNNLKDKFKKSQFTRMAIQNIQYTQTFYKIPFLKKNYEEFSKEYTSKILVENKETFLNLYETQNRYTEYSTNKNTNTIVIGNLKNVVLNGEQFISSSISSILTPLIQSVRKECPEIFEIPDLTDDFSLDLIFLMIKKWEEMTVKKDLHQGGQAVDSRSDKYKILNILQNKFKFFRQICSIMIPHSESKNEIETSLIASSILSICFQSEMKFVFNLIEISNIELKEFINLTNSFPKKEGPFQVQYGVFNLIVTSLQGRVIPDFNDSSYLKYLKNRYSDMITESLKSVVKGTQNYDLKYMIILLDLIEILPRNEADKYLTEISQAKKEQDRLGGNFDIGFIKTYITKILKVVHLISPIEIDSLSLVISEYVNTNAQSLNFNLFIGDEFDPLFAKIGLQNEEMVAASLAQDISFKIDSFYSLKSLQEVIHQIDYSRSLSAYDTFLSTLNLKKSRNRGLIVSLVDKLCYLGQEAVQALPDYEFIKIFDFILNKNDFKTNHTSLNNIIQYAMVRLVHSQDNMEILQHDKKAIQLYDALVIDKSRSKEMFIDNPNAFPFIYFLQNMIVQHGDMAKYHLQYRSVLNVSGLVMDEDSSGSIVFFDKKVQEYYIDTNNKLSDYAYNNEFQKMVEIIKRQYNGSQKFNHYVVGVVLLNKFINPVSKEDANLIQNIKNLFIKALESVEMAPLYKQLLLAIIRGDKFNFKKFLGDENTTDPNYETRLKKVFYQFLLLSVCFEKEVGYDLGFFNKWIQGNFDSTTFKAQIVSTDEISNYGSIFENIVVERLSDGSYMDYGPQYVANLGIYKCSCDYVYSIGNCGYAMVTRPCPKCNQPIGGENHHSVQRKGHDHLKSLEEFNSLIQKAYKKKDSTYNPHIVVNKSSLEITPIKLNEIGVKSVVQSLKQKGSESILSNFFISLMIRHLFDHLLIISLPEILKPEESNKFIESLKKLLPYNDKNFKEIFGKMSGRKIENHYEYFIAHVKNDIEVLSQTFLFRNPIKIFDYLRALLSSMAERILSGKAMSKTNIMVEDLISKEPDALLQVQQSIADQIRDNELDLKTVFKNILFRNIKPGLMTSLFNKHGSTFESIYQFMRHNSFNPQHIKQTFVDSLQTKSSYGLLKNIVNYSGILRDFPEIVDANAKISFYFNNNYDRAYNFDEASELNILTLDDASLKRIYNEFVRVWQTLIPQHEDKNPEVFSFAFMCQADLNVKNYIDGIIDNGDTKLIRFLFVDPNEYNDKSLLYMKSIVRTFVEKFHNQFVEKINKTLQLDITDEKNAARKNIEYCTQDDYVASCNWEKHMLNNFWYETTVSGENRLHFDYKRIEYLCAQDMKKPMINFDEKDIKYYNFKNTKMTQYEHNLKELIKKVKHVGLSQDLVQLFEELPEVSISKSYEFILEIGNYILGNFLFNDERILLKSIVQSKSESSLLQRFSSYEESIHSKLMLGHLGDLYTLLKDQKFEWDMSHNRENYNVELKKDQVEGIMELIEDPNLTSDDLERVKADLRQIISENYTQGPEFFKNPLTYFGWDISDISPAAEKLKEVMACQYHKMLDILNQGIIVKSKKSYVKKRSSIMSE